MPIDTTKKKKKTETPTSEVRDSSGYTVNTYKNEGGTPTKEEFVKGPSGDMLKLPEGSIRPKTFKTQEEIVRGIDPANNISTSLYGTPETVSSQDYFNSTFDAIDRNRASRGEAPLTMDQKNQMIIQNEMGFIGPQTSPRTYVRENGSFSLEQPGQLQRMGQQEQQQVQSMQQIQNMTPEQIAQLTPEQRQQLGDQPINPVSVGGIVGGGIAGATAGAGIGAGIGALLAPATAGASIPIGTAIGATAGFIGGALTKITLDEKQNIKQVKESFTGIKDNFAKIQQAASSDPTYRNQALIDWNNEKQNLYRVEQVLKRKTENKLDEFLGSPGDEYIEVQSYIRSLPQIERTFFSGYA